MPRRKTTVYPALNYFECNLPRHIPSYYAPEIYSKLQQCVDAVYKRTALLNAACDRLVAETGMRPSTVHKLAKMV